MSESNMWRNMRKAMKNHWQEVTRHEDKFNPGIADVSFVSQGAHGWMELKQIDKWPVRPGTIVRCKHFTADQKRFLRSKGEAGGNVWLFAKIQRTYLLFHWSHCHEFGELNQAGTRKLASYAWENRMNWEELGNITGAGAMLF